MSTLIEFGNGLPDPLGCESVDVEFENDGISLIASDGAKIVGSVRDLRTLAFVLLGMTDSRDAMNLAQESDLDALRRCIRRQPRAVSEIDADIARAPDRLLATNTLPGQAVEVNLRTGEVTLRYTRQHIPTANETKGEQTFPGCRAALEALARWNAQQPETWLYWL